MSLRLAPSAAHPTSHSTTSFSAPAAPGVHDLLRAGLGPDAYGSTSSNSGITNTTPSATPASTHPLEARLLAWSTTQETRRLTTLRRTFGLAEPVRRGMEIGLVRAGDWRPVALRQGSGVVSLSEEVLRGDEAACEWEDVYTGEVGGILGGAAAGAQGVLGSVRGEMERRLGIGA